MSLVGRLVYGNCHHEPLGSDTPLSDRLADLNAPDTTRYFAAQSSCHRIFLRRELPSLLDGWEVCVIRPITSFAYLGSGGFRGPQIYPEVLYPLVKLIDGVLGLVPLIFAARVLVCISKEPRNPETSRPGGAKHLKFLSGFYRAEQRPSVFTSAYRKLLAHRYNLIIPGGRTRA